MTHIVSVKRIFEETTPFILIFAVIVLLSGGFLGSITEEFKMIPGLLILLPPLLGLRGNIGSSMASRLSSALHMGYIKPNKMTKSLKVNIYAAIFLSFFMSFILGFLSWITCFFIGSGCISIVAFITISMLAGVISSIVLIFVSIFIAEISFKEGLDPDNVTTQSIGSLGDIITIITFVVVVKLVIMWGMI
ncbi:MAG: magnesium transporter [Candidatus Aenigmatarchaeota archaeon]|nr:magnesium transporter [Nanoarchaeota archaeon]